MEGKGGDEKGGRREGREGGEGRGRRRREGRGGLSGNVAEEAFCLKSAHGSVSNQQLDSQDVLLCANESVEKHYETFLQVSVTRPTVYIQANRLMR